jgi:hypothetical protein
VEVSHTRKRLEARLISIPSAIVCSLVEGIEALIAGARFLGFPLPAVIRFAVAPSCFPFLSRAAPLKRSWQVFDCSLYPVDGIREAADVRHEAVKYQIERLSPGRFVWLACR